MNEMTITKESLLSLEAYAKIRKSEKPKIIAHRRLRTVHLGEHHGLQGLLLVVTALLLSRELPRMRPTRMRVALAAYLSLMIPYGVANMANDAWLEQVVKRGWTDWAIPGVIRPGLTWMWGLIVLVGAAIFFTALQPGADQPSTHSHKRAV